MGSTKTGDFKINNNSQEQPNSGTRKPMIGSSEMESKRSNERHCVRHVSKSTEMQSIRMHLIEILENSIFHIGC